MSIRRQCELLSVSRSTVYYKSKANLDRKASDSVLRVRIWEIFSAQPVFGYRRVCAMLRRDGCDVNPKRVRSRMREMGLQAIYPKGRLSLGNALHKKYPYLLELSIIHI